MGASGSLGRIVAAGRSPRTRCRRGWALAALLAIGSLAPVTSASERDVLLLPTRTAPCPRCATAAASEGEPHLTEWATRVDTLMAEAALDLGLTATPPEPLPEGRDEATLVEAAGDRWVVSPTVTADGPHLFVRIEAVAPGSSVVLVRASAATPEELEVRAVTMLRDVVEAGNARTTKPAPTPASPPEVVEATRSPGRAVLAVNSAALGGYIGFALQRAGGSSDPRLTFPLIALGTGIGLGASMIAADEWDVGVGDAWYLTAGAWWPTASALLLTGSYDEPSKNRFVYSIGASAAGVGLATLALTFGEMSNGGAILAHSGGAYGTALGGLVQLLYEGRTDVTPTRGMGWGAGAGVLTAGVVARFLPDPTSSRVLLVDLGIGIGGLTGAAVSSPIVFADTGTGTKSRLLLSSIGAGMLAGGVTAYLLTSRGDATADEGATWSPFVGALTGPTSTGFGGGIQGLW